MGGHLGKTLHWELTLGVDMGRYGHLREYITLGVDMGRYGHLREDMDIWGKALHWELTT